jgi:NTP pyrophosphatase (non-canonical NTP hydrolase)
MKSKTEETLVILQEECAEVIQAVSKILRFGFQSRYPTEDSASTKECLEMEAGQLLCMIGLLVEQGAIDEESMVAAMEHKKVKLKEWSNIFNADNA